jgi:hypothetical protein
MLRKLRLHLTYANVASSIALFLALGGVSYAAVHLPRNSVGSKQIKKNAVTAAKVKNRSLTLGDFKKGQLPAGARGLQGPQGERGLQGETGPSGTSGAHLVIGDPATIAAINGFGTATVTCPTGERVLSGSFNQIDGLPSITVFRTSIIDAGTTFQADGQNVSGSTNRVFSVYAICAA